MFHYPILGVIIRTSMSVPFRRNLKTTLQPKHSGPVLCIVVV